MAPVIKVFSFDGKHRSDDIDDSKEVSWFDLDVFDVGVSWQYESAFSMLHEIHASHRISFEVHIILRAEDFRLQ
jgi:hypothetical protein